MNQETRTFEEQRKILDSGVRREFETGAVRDIAEGKGRCDLLPLEQIGNYIIKCAPADKKRYEIAGAILIRLNSLIHMGYAGITYECISLFIQNGYNGSTIDAILELSKHYEEGAKKYDERNWEKGIPCHCYIDSAIRHLLKWADDWTDEPHDRAFLWNMFGLLWTMINKPELNDLPWAKEVENG